MNREFVEKVSGIERVRKVLARQHVSPDGLVTRFENLLLSQEQDPALKNNPEEPDSIPSQYSLDVSHSSNKM